MCGIYIYPLIHLSIHPSIYLSIFFLESILHSFTNVYLSIHLSLLRILSIVLSPLAYPILREIPFAVIIGVFFYLAYASFSGIQLRKRLKLLFTPPKHHPDIHYVRKVTASYSYYSYHEEHILIPILVLLS